MIDPNSPESDDDPSLPATPPIDVLYPDDLTIPLVLSSPHSGSWYPDEFIAASSLDRRVLRRSEDCFVDELFGSAPELGAPLLRANYPRAFLDLNREPYELDPAMFDGPLPDYVNTTSARVAAGLGTIARIVSTHKEIYRRKLQFDEAKARVEMLYKPYHQTLRRLVNDARDRFGFCILIDCHSMPSTGLPVINTKVAGGVDVVIGDRNGLSCAPRVSDAAHSILSDLGYGVVRNNPYAGGFTTHHYGSPEAGIHAIQIEINRRLYMDEHTLQPSPGFNRLKRDLNTFLGRLASFAAEDHPALRQYKLSAE